MLASGKWELVTGRYAGGHSDNTGVGLLAVYGGGE